MDRRSFKRKVELDPEFGWFNILPIEPNQPDEEHRRYRRQKAYMSFFMIPMGLIVAIAAPFVLTFWIGPLGVVVGLVISALMVLYAVFGAFLGVRIFRDTKPIPQDPINLPRPIRMTKDEEWRKPTPVRYLEDLKKSIDEMEGEAVGKFKRLQDAFANVEFPSSYLEYETAMGHLKNFQEFSSKYEHLKESANRVYAGEVNAEINELQTRIRHLQRERQEMDANYSESQSRVQETQGRRIANALAGAGSAQIKRNIKDIDLEVLKLESYISELKKLDQNLIRVTAKPTAAGQRERIAKLRQDKKEELNAMESAGESEEDIRRRANILDNAIEEAEEKLREML